MFDNFGLLVDNKLNNLLTIEFIRINSIIQSKWFCDFV